MPDSEFISAVQFITKFGYWGGPNLLEFCRRWRGTDLVNYATYLAAAE
jgi:hypothetical protein